VLLPRVGQVAQRQVMDGRAWIALVVVYIVWGSTYLAIRWTVASAPALLSAATRFLLAGALLGGASLLLRGRAVWRVERFRLAWASLSGILLLLGGNGLVVIAETHIPSGLAALLVAAVPLWLVVMRRAVGDRTTPLTILGVVVGLAGVALLLLPGSKGHVDIGYSLLVVLAAFCWALGSLFAARRPMPADAMVLSTVEMIAGGLALLVVGSLRGEWAGFSLGDITLRSWLSWSYLVIFGSILAFSCYLWVLSHAPTSLVATYAYVNPAVAVVLGVALAGERLLVSEIVGGGVIIAAVVVVVTSENRARTPAPPPPVGEECSVGTP
jgi:drug/metabolite transporter (DMT)-like permease